MNTVSLNLYHKSEVPWYPYDHVYSAGWRCVSVASHPVEEAAYAAPDWRDYIKSVRAELDSRGMRCVQTHLPAYDLHIDSAEENPVTNAALEHGVEATAMLGARWAAFHCRTHFDMNDIAGAHERSYEDNHNLIRRLLPIARDCGVGIAIENLPDYIMPGPSHLFATDYRDVIRLADEFNDPEHVGICWDFGHAQMNHVDQVAALREVGGRLHATHIHSNGGFNDEHYPVSMGTINWDTVMRTLAEIGYEDSLSLEGIWPGSPVSGTTYKMAGYEASQEMFAEEYFRHGLRCAEILRDRLESYKAKL